MRLKSIDDLSLDDLMLLCVLPAAKVIETQATVPDYAALDARAHALVDALDLDQKIALLACQPGVLLSSDAKAMFTYKAR